MNVVPIDAEAFCFSIEKALHSPLNVEDSIRRIQKTINSLPDGGFYGSVRGDCVTFSTVVNGKQKYISKKDDHIYSFARKKYLTMLLRILQLTDSKKVKDIRQREEWIVKLQKFIRVCAQGKLDIARIVLTKQQYDWFMGVFKQKPIEEDTPFKSRGGLPVRSKSERDIANANEEYGVPLHYEEQLVIYVKPFVTRLQDNLRTEGKLRGKLYSYVNGKIYWNVPEELEWMNSPGSIWKTYDARDGTITIYSDFRIMLVDSSVFFWEHMGLMIKFVYRCNAGERVAIMKYTETADRDHFLETYEHDIDTREKIHSIIEEVILPRIWF